MKPSAEPGSCSCSWCLSIFFFFQAEDGIRDIGVTGVQTCALPISPSCVPSREAAAAPGKARPGGDGGRGGGRSRRAVVCREIGRASCRERVEISVVAVSLKKKKKTIEHIERPNH